jgi:hypothetical protein
MAGKPSIHKQRFVERRFMKKMVVDYGELPPDKIEVCEHIHSKYRPLHMDQCRFLYRLAAHCDDLTEIKEIMDLYASHGWKRPYNDNTIECFQFCYGKEEGQRIYDARCVKNREHTLQQIKDGKNPFTNGKAKEACKVAIAKLVAEDPLWHRKRIRGCREFYISRGITDPKVIEEEIRKVSSYLPRYTKDEYIAKFGIEKWNALNEAKIKGMRDKGVVGRSKESNMFFEEVVKLCGFDSDFYRYAKSFKGEYWVQHEDEYFFIDFCIPSAKIAIEYNGYRYHPKYEHDIAYELRRSKSMRPLAEKWAYDEKKREAIKTNGFLLIEVWSDNLPEMTTFCDELKRIVDERLKSLSAV